MKNNKYKYILKSKTQKFFEEGYQRTFLPINRSINSFPVINSNSKKTAFALIKKACKEQLYPVVKMDIEMTGLLLFTNDGDIHKKLNHLSLFLMIY